MKISLVAPKCSRRPMDSLWKVRMSPPLGLLVVGALTPPEHEVTLVDENVERCRFRDTPDLDGITVKADTFHRACEIAAAYRGRGVRVVMGGIHPTVCPDECSPHADAVVVGESEVLWPRLLADAAVGRLQSRYVNDGPDVFDNTVDWLERNHVSTMTAHILTPYPADPPDDLFDYRPSRRGLVAAEGLLVGGHALRLHLPPAPCAFDTAFCLLVGTGILVLGSHLRNHSEEKEVRP
jgi:hypothetical protein